MRRWCLVPGLLAVVACGGEEERLCPDLPSGGATLEIGGSDELAAEFEGYADGAERPLVFGTQGGFHVFMHLRGRGLCSGAVVIETRVFEPGRGDEMVAFQRQPVPFDDAADATVEMRGAVPLILCPSPRATAVEDQRFRVTVTATDRDGREASAETSFVAVCDPSVQGGNFVDDCHCLCGTTGC